MFSKATLNTLLMAGSAVAAVPPYGFHGYNPYNGYNNGYNWNHHSYYPYNAGSVTASNAGPTQYTGYTPSSSTQVGNTYIPTSTDQSVDGTFTQTSNTVVSTPVVQSTVTVGGTITTTVTITPSAVTTTTTVPPTGLAINVNVRDLEKRQRGFPFGHHGFPGYFPQPYPFPTQSFQTTQLSQPTRSSQGTLSSQATQSFQGTVSSQSTQSYQPPFANSTVTVTASAGTITVTVTASAPTTVTATATCSAINVGASAVAETFTPVFVGTGVTADTNSVTALNGGAAITNTLAAGLDACTAIAQCASLTANDAGGYESFDIYLLNGAYVCVQFPAILAASDFDISNIAVGASYGYALPIN